MNGMNRADLLHAISEQSRAFATIGLLRIISEETPLDMIISYLEKTGQLGILSSIVCVFSELREDEEGSLVDRLNNRIPTGMRKMAKEYLVRTFWKNIDHLISNDCMRVDVNGGHPWTTDAFCGSENDVMLYPKVVLETLAGMRTLNISRLWDAKNDVGNLHAVCTPVFMERPPWTIRDRYEFERIDMNKMDTIRDRESRSVSSLYTTLLNYCWDSDHRKCIPNQAEKDILLNLIECFLIMFGPKSFAFNFRVKDAYDHQRMGSIDYIHSGSCDPVMCSDGDVGINKFKRSDFFKARNGVNMILDKMKYFSPEAALCFSFDQCGALNSLNKLSILKRVHPVPSKEVELYLYTEMNVVNNKAKLAKRITEAIKRGEFNSNKIDEYACPEGCAPCCDEPVRSYDCGC